MPDQPGWYPDPANRDAAARWWDGNQWTSHVRPGTPPPPVGHGTLVSDAAPRMVPGWTPPRAPASETSVPFPQPSAGNVLSRSSLSVASMALTLVLMVGVVHGGVLWLGLIPLVLAIMGYKLHERLAVPALVTSVLGLLVNFYVVAHR